MAQEPRELSREEREKVMRLAGEIVIKTMEEPLQTRHAVMAMAVAMLFAPYPHQRRSKFLRMFMQLIKACVPIVERVIAETADDIRAEEISKGGH